jgi:hypothetical protein
VDSVFSASPEDDPPPNLTAAKVGVASDDDVVPTDQGSTGQEVCGSPTNTTVISAFHKSLSDLAHSFSSILISEDEKNVLQSAE